MIQFLWEAQDVSQAARTMLFEAWLRHDSRETAQAGCHKILKHRKKCTFQSYAICMVTSRCVQIMSIISETPSYRRHLVL